MVLGTRSTFHTVAAGDAITLYSSCTPDSSLVVHQLAVSSSTDLDCNSSSSAPEAHKDQLPHLKSANTMPVLVENVYLTGCCQSCLLISSQLLCIALNMQASQQSSVQCRRW